MDSIHTPAEDATGPHRPRPAAERSLGELFRELSADGSRLVRQEIALARAEMRRNVAAVTGHAGMVAVGAAMAVAGALVLMAALVAFLGDVLLGERYWLAALLVGVLLLGGGGALAFLAVKRMGAGGMAPAETLAALRETSGWARAEVEDLREALSSGVVPHTSGNGRGTPYLRLHTDGNGGEPEEASAARGGTGRGTAAGRRRVASRGKEPGPLPVSEPLWKRVVHEFQEDDLTNQAAKVAYYFFLSLPPLLMAIFGLAGIFGGQPTADWLTERLGRVLPTEAGGLVNDFVNQVVHDKAPGLLTVGLLLALWAAANVIMALEDTLNDAFEVTAERGFIQKRVTALAVLLGVSVLFLGGSVILLAGPALARAMGLGPTGDVVWSVLQWPLSFALVVGAFWVIYYFLPNQDQSGCKRTLLKSSALAAALWLVATAGFKLYIANFSSYSATYGLLGTVIVLQLWMWMTSLVILLGGEISSEMERTA
jgi:membrane protein